MKIGIIGAGNIGGNLTRRFTAAGHEVRVANSRGPETLADLAAETGATAVTVAQASLGADVVVVTIPQKNVPDLPADVFAGAAAGLVVIDTGNYYPQQRDGQIAEIEDGQPESAWVAGQLGRPVVKAFNGIYAANLLTHGRPDGDPSRLALPIAGDETGIVRRLIEEIGFTAVDAGPISESWRQQPGTPVYGLDADADGVRTALAAASPERTADWKA